MIWNWLADNLRVQLVFVVISEYSFSFLGLLSYTSYTSRSRLCDNALCSQSIFNFFSLADFQENTAHIFQSLLKCVSTLPREILMQPEMLLLCLGRQFFASLQKGNAVIISCCGNGSDGLHRRRHSPNKVLLIGRST